MRYEEAIAESERAATLDPNNADLYIMRASVLNFAGRPEEALKIAEQALRFNPRYPPNYLWVLGVAYNGSGRYNEAIATLQEFSRRVPGHLGGPLSLAFSYLGQWYSQKNPDAQTLEHALAAAQRVIALNETYPGGHVGLGFVYLTQKQYEQAIAEMERAIALNPKDAWGYAYLAKTLSHVGRSKEAVEMAEQALRRNPSGNMYLDIGIAYYLAGRPEEAITALKQFLTYHPNMLGGHLTLAAVYSELGKEAEARAEGAEVLRINPKFSLEVHKERTPIKDPAMLERHIAVLRKAGLK
jgi:tetratricopeptide (TPR) repeat protein